MEIKNVQHFSGVKLNHRLSNVLLEIVLSGSHRPSGIYCFILLLFSHCVDLYLLDHQDDVKWELALTSSSSSRLEGALEEPSACLENAVILLHFKELFSPHPVTSYPTAFPETWQNVMQFLARTEDPEEICDCDTV